MSLKLFATISIVIYGIFGANATPTCSNFTTVAGGGLPNYPLPATISEDGIREIQVAQFIKQLEVAFFNEGLANMTKWDTNGYANNTVQIVNTITSQQQVHLENFVTLLETYEAPVIPPCNYSFPVSSTEQFFQLAHFIGSVGIGSTIGLSERISVTDPALMRLISSILAVESRHDAFFRYIRGEAPSPAPFDTGSNSLWAYNSALAFVVPGSCPFQLPVPITPRVTLTKSAPLSPHNSTNRTSEASWEFGWDPTQQPFVVNQGKELLIGWVNQANAPVYTPLEVTGKGKGTAEVPENTWGIVFAVVTTDQYDQVNHLELGTIAGPALISI